MNTDQYSKFLESLKVNNDGPEEMNGWRFDDDISDFDIKHMPARPSVKFLTEMIDYLVERCRRAESNVKPSDLVEQVNAFMRAGMDAQSKSDNAMEKEGQHYWDEISDEFRHLSEPESQ